MYQDRDAMPAFKPAESKERGNREQEIIRLLKEKGLEDPESEELLAKYIAEQEKLGEQSEYYIDGEVQKNFLRARIYAEADYKEEALDIFYPAQDDAFHSRGKSTLSGKIIEEIEKIEGTSEAA